MQHRLRHRKTATWPAAVASVVVAIVCALVVTACGSPTLVDAPHGSTLSCPPVSLIHDMLGGHAIDPVRQDEDDGFFCLYEDPRPHGPADPGTATVRVWPKTDSATFDHLKADLLEAKVTLTELPGLGDNAFGYFGGVTPRVIVRKGSVVLDVFANAPLDKVKAFVQRLLTVLE